MMPPFNALWVARGFLRTVFIVGGVAFLTPSCSEEKSPHTNTSSAAHAVAQSEITFTGDDEYCGMFGEGDNVSRTVAIRNNGQSAVRVRVLASSCGCVSAKLEGEMLGSVSE